MGPMGANILLIDDQLQTLGSLLVALREQGCSVAVADSGRKGLERAQTLLPDLILLDVRMPGMDGFATCRLLKESPRTHDIPVIFLTSAGGCEDRLVGLSDGGVDYVTKPFQAAEVVARVRIHLRLSGRGGKTASSAPAPLLSRDEIILRAAMRRIHADLAALPSLDELARQVGTHDKRLSVIFRKQLGMTVFAWVREERLRASRQLLADPDMSIHDIAARIGFRSAANFATAFRQRMGMTPSRYRDCLCGDTTQGDAHVG